MRRGTYDEAELERQLQARGMMNRFFGRLTRRIRRPVHMYPVGVLFGLGFDTASPPIGQRAEGDAPWAPA